jgi:YidC/Oxa1 family membrane protein insertase
MDIKRILPLAAIAVVSYLLLLEWQEFKTRESVTGSAVISENIGLLLDENSSSMPVTVPSSDEVPSIVSAKEKAPELVVSQQTLQIKTDVLDLRISTAGGDIVYAGLLKHRKSLEGDNEAFALLQQSEQHNYVAQSGLVGNNGTDKAGERPLFKVQELTHVLAEGEDKISVDLTLTQPNGVELIKRYTLHRNNYLVDVEYLINNQSTETWNANFYAQLKRDNAPDPSAGEGGGLGIQPFLGVATTTDEERFLKIAFGDIKEEKFKAEKQGGWIAMIQHYFLTAWVPEKDSTYQYSTLVTRSGDNLARVMGPNIQVAAGQQGQIQSHFYAGPKDQYKLEKIAEGLDLSVDYGFLWMIAQPLYALMYGFSTGEFHAFGGQIDIGAGLANWGFAIILLTVLVKAIFFYPSAISYRSMAKMRKLQPKLASLKDLYPDDRQKQSQEMMSLYRKEGVNPLGGCLPILIQMPVFISLYWVLLESVELRHAPFIGYIHDLSAMDPYFFMPLLMGASMFVQQKLNPPPPDPMQAKILQWMPVFFTVFFLWFPAGLVLYWVVNNLLSIAQQYVITKRIEAED